jgi:hypothetical protein
MIDPVNLISAAAEFSMVVPRKQVVVCWMIIYLTRRRILQDLPQPPQINRVSHEQVL